MRYMGEHQALAKLGSGVSALCQPPVGPVGPGFLQPSAVSPRLHASIGAQSEQANAADGGRKRQRGVRSQTLGLRTQGFLSGLGLSAGLALIGCAGLPPTRTAGGIAASGTARERAALTGEGSISVRPLSAFKALATRRAEFGVGVYGLYAGRSEGQEPEATRVTWLVGPTATVEGYPILQVDPWEGDVLRMVVGAEARTLYNAQQDAWGPFLSPRVGIEFASWVQGCEAQGSAQGIGVGCGVGEAGIGIFAEGQAGVIQEDVHYSIGLSVAVRAPAAVVGGIPFP